MENKFRICSVFEKIAFTEKKKGIAPIWMRFYETDRLLKVTLLSLLEQQDTLLMLVISCTIVRKSL